MLGLESDRSSRVSRILGRIKRHSFQSKDEQRRLSHHEILNSTISEPVLISSSIDAKPRSDSGRDFDEMNTRESVRTIPSPTLDINSRYYPGPNIDHLTHTEENGFTEESRKALSSFRDEYYIPIQREAHLNEIMGKHLATKLSGLRSNEARTKAAWTQSEKNGDSLKAQEPYMTDYYAARVERIGVERDLVRTVTRSIQLDNISSRLDKDYHALSQHESPRLSVNDRERHLLKQDPNGRFHQYLNSLYNTHLTIEANDPRPNRSTESNQSNITSAVPQSTALTIYRPPASLFPNMPVNMLFPCDISRMDRSISAPHALRPSRISSLPRSVSYPYHYRPPDSFSLGRRDSMISENPIFSKLDERMIPQNSDFDDTAISNAVKEPLRPASISRFFINTTPSQIAEVAENSSRTPSVDFDDQTPLTHVKSVPREIDSPVPKHPGQVGDFIDSRKEVETPPLLPDIPDIPDSESDTNTVTTANSSRSNSPISFCGSPSSFMGQSPPPNDESLSTAVHSPLRRRASEILFSPGRRMEIFRESSISPSTSNQPHSTYDRPPPITEQPSSVEYRSLSTAKQSPSQLPFRLASNPYDFDEEDQTPTSGREIATISSTAPPISEQPISISDQPLSIYAPTPSIGEQPSSTYYPPPSTSDQQSSTTTAPDQPVYSSQYCSTSNDAFNGNDVNQVSLIDSHLNLNKGVKNESVGNRNIEIWNSINSSRR